MPLGRNTASVGSSQAEDFLRSGLPGTKFWTPTIVNPAKQTSTANTLLWWAHILLHVISLCLSCTNGFAAAALQAADSTCTATDLYCFDTAPNTGFVTIAVSGSICHILGVVMILFAASFWHANDYKKQQWYHALLMFAMNFSMCASLLVWAMASLKYHSLAFWLAAPGAIIQLFSLCMLFSTSAAIGSKNIVRVFVFTMAVAVDLMVALLFQVGTWGHGMGHIDATHKTFMWVCFTCQFSAQVVLLLGRMFTGNTLSVKTMSTYPFFRSIVLTLLAISAISSSFRFNVAGDAIAASFMIPATIFSWWSFIYAILPNDANVYPPKVAGDEDEEAPEMDEDDEEAVEAKYHSGLNMNRVSIRK